MNCEIKRLDHLTAHFLPYEHQPFEVIGRFIPAYDGVKWSYKEVLCKESRQKKYKDDVIDPKDYIENDRQAIFLAVCDNLCVGAVRISTGWSGDAVIEDLAVGIQYRRQGLGKKLMDGAVAWCRKQRYERITLETQDNNLQACRFYVKYGFALCGINTKIYALMPEYRDETALYFCLEIPLRHSAVLL